MLKMKSCCEQCNAPLDHQGVAFICSFECTFCQNCTEVMGGVCPNCDGELVCRPRRKRNPVEVATARLKKKLFN